MIDEFLDFMGDEVIIEPWEGQLASGEPSYGSPVTYKGRVVGKVRKVVNALGQETVSAKTLYLGSPVQVDPMDRITLPDPHLPKQPRIISSGIFPDESGAHHSEIYL